jgi:tRNA-dihydrouridine synthase
MENFWQNIPRPIIGLSPMDGVTDASFRHITAKHGGPDVTLTEFVNIQSAIFAPDILLKDFTYSEIERPIAAQIYGKTPELFYKVAHIVGELGFDGLDINMGCPAKKVAAAGCGAALIRTPELAREIIQAARKGIEDWANGQTLEQIGIRPGAIAAFRNANRLRTGTDIPAPRRRIPLSVKTRIGYERNAIDQWIPTLLDEKPAAITLHGRTLQQGYKGDADWEAIGRAAELAKGSATLILGNGDLRDMADVHRRISDTQVDGVLIGRASQGNPWLFAGKQQVKQARLGFATIAPQQPITLDERFEVIREHSRHYENMVQIRCFVGMRKHLIWYCRDFRGAAEMRSQMVRLNNSDEVERCLEHFRQSFVCQAHHSALGSAAIAPASTAQA